MKQYALLMMAAEIIYLPNVGVGIEIDPLFWIFWERVPILTHTQFMQKPMWRYLTSSLGPCSGTMPYAIKKSSIFPWKFQI